MNNLNLKLFKNSKLCLDKATLILPANTSWLECKNNFLKIKLDADASAFTNQHFSFIHKLDSNYLLFYKSSTSFILLFEKSEIDILILK